MLDELEAALWQQPDNDKRLADYQHHFRHMENRLTGNDARHHFIIVIPVADRPQHLEACLGSILTLCETFDYGGTEGGRYRKVSVLVADDSKESNHIARHREIAADFDRRGLTTHYFGQTEQLAQLARLDTETRHRLTPIIGDIPEECFYHKGASIMRNITYLKLHEMVGGRDDTLFYFIDSDQEFQVRIAGDHNRYTINYLYQLDRLFREHDIAILTGKVVGDPPVSPAVMAGNFLDDVDAFIQAMAARDAATPCDFHGSTAQNCDDAAYHDMADLFGFRKKGFSFDYHCSLQGEHDHAACLADFAARLNRFFDGEHPTRKSYYEHQPLDASVVPARTIYTGNYCFRARALHYFIPFATLKLRMAGPVLGRILKAELGERFVSANLPMLHKRTVDELGQSEFRPGIERKAQTVDLSGEFERQFFGDVMLFTMEELTVSGYPSTELSEKTVRETVERIEHQMLENYTTKHRHIISKMQMLKEHFSDKNKWWWQDQGLAPAREAFEQFIANMENNFGDSASGYKQIHNTEHRAARRLQMIDAILGYRDDRRHWHQILENGLVSA